MPEGAMAVETQSVDILHCFSALEDPRQRTKVIYPLAEILLLVLDAVADTDTLVMPAHFPGPTAGHVVAAGDNYRFRFLDG